jgi:hypothetical protein
LDKDVLAVSPGDATAQLTQGLNELGEADDSFSTIEYPKRTTYKGKQIDELGRERQLILTLIPNRGDYDDLYSNNSGPKLETQSTFHPQVFETMSKQREFKQLSMDTLSGRNNDGFTVEAVLFDHDGKMYEISSYRKNLFQMTANRQGYASTINSLYAQHQEVDEFALSSTATQGPFEDDDENFQLLSQFNQLSNIIDILYDQQADSAYDLTIIEIEPHPFECGNTNHDHAHTAEDKAAHPEHDESPFLMQSQYSLTRWVGCHSRMGKQQTIFPIQFYLARNFQAYASNTLDYTKIVAANIAPRLHIILSIMNVFMGQQMDVSYGLAEINNLNTAGTTYDPNQGVSSNVVAALDDFDTYVSSRTRKGALVHNLQHNLDFGNVCSHKLYNL